MSITVREFPSIGEFAKSLDDLIAEYRKMLGDLLRKLEELRIKSEQEKKLKSILTKLGVAETTPPNVLELRNLRIVVNPSPHQELSALEALVEALNNKISALAAIRKDLETLSGLDVGLKILVVYIDDVPRTVMLKFS